ncbi:EfeM/EfeO family lipoprotein [Actinomadura barringtoniae]|uniref:EfeM/EfeO family lipoprotein n=1 Tax=Actinomadura barringtoniae TaxID=1427535 RepID=A0A939T3U3_9ACTN|nr:EfeM/EfeO family lipoprotein [Actinomadura barringtoniae]MBO2451671.1 EfeM/EfeO family lipoprotein [Actinomadura barringtoniae]
MRSSTGLVVLVGGAVLLLAGAGDAATAPRPAAAAPMIQAAVGACGTGWAQPHAGPQTLVVHNGGSTVAEISLLNASGGVLGELEGIGPGTSRSLRVTLGAGTYSFRCADEGAGDPVTGPRTRIGGTEASGPAIVPVTENELYGPTQKYRAYVEDGLKRLIAQTGTLTSAIDGGDLGAARAAWTPAHMSYERLGAAYGTFGDLDEAINGSDSGFHRLERGLWHGEDAAALKGPADQLGKDVRALRGQFADERTDPADLPLRAHEILEDTLRFQLTGKVDFGSHTDLRSVAANLEGTREAVDVLRPVLKNRFAGLAEVDDWMDRLDKQLKGRSSLGDLSREERERLDGTVGKLVELLASVATIAEPRRTS